MKVVIRDISEIKNSNLDSLISLLPEYRQKQVNSYKQTKTKLLSILAGLIIHDEIGNLDKEIYLNKYGKGYLPTEEKLFFSISHSGSKVMVVFSDKEIGCDIEMVKPCNLNIAKRFFNENEYNEIINSNDPNKLFIKYWTIKESALKCIGTGLNRKLKDIKINNSKLDSEEIILLKSTEIDGYFYSICELN